ncbi:BspA family leucine-rich repeat surface protein [Limosilactobacillus reuteri]|uniref:MBG domain-containing protein n=1 Tax=Limosilactobacillus reuteri TaxID=1598 RepID=UPI001E4E0C54|nr:MBG domain-containing protein [Limosilactobacillus reuteri]MCC4435405.1 BspA family leucine-rich repeat surface protein [Limosilactobacillus reuteri]MCC4437954.1 BspA family leucine-rich repeat surface protein [Limosilactobacillus reuteri]MCC4441402.1 BspA family leucine-rich repeat surface protein [Limosilactobacillus reuteri]MCC4443393.1 BspA family leucine-rich repeat surface protein [Limosilactobacillus reuteri]MCC4445556.1 BspA family leucine-rich repeat surface protein [Limosilactobac
MGKNNPLRSMTPKNKNYKLYKAKKQWITACATFMLAFGATAVVNASVQADTTTPATTQASGSTVTATESAQPQSSGVETAQNTDETKGNVVADTTDAARTSEQKTTTAQDAENSSSASSANKTNSEEENKNAFLALNVNTAENPANETLQENKIAATTAATNGGYDSATWGTLDTSKWTGQNTTFDGTDYYQLTGYTGDQTHIIVPNEADFAAAGTSTNGLQVAISNDLLNQWKNATTIAFSKTEDKKVKLASTNLNNTFQNDTSLTNLDANSLDTSSVTSMQSTFDGAYKLSSLTGISDWDVSNVTNMYALFQNATGLTSLTGLENWDVQKVTNMSRIFNNINKVTDLSPLSNWKTNSLQKLNTAFANNSFTNLQGLENWNVSHVTDMGVIFMSDANLTDISALANWDTSNVTDLNRAFNVNPALTSLHGLENWNTSNVTNLNATFANEGSLVDASAIANWNTSNVTNMSVLFAGSNAQYIDFSNWDFSKVTSASNVINNTKSVVYLGNNSTLTADKLNTLGLSNFGTFNQPIVLTSGALYTLLSGKNSNTHTITINNASGSQLTTISVPVVYDASSASNMTDAINSYKDMVDQKLEDYITEHNYVLKRVSTAPVDDVTGHNNHLVNYADATYQVVTIPADQKKEIQIQDKTVYKGNSLTAKDLVANSADFPAGTTFEFVDNSEPNWNQLGTYDVKVIATYPVSVNGQQYTAITAPATAKVTVTDQMQFTITYWDDTENKEIVQFDIANAGNGAYDNQLSFPKGVNTNNYQSVSVSGVPAGVTIAGDFWKPFTDPSCNWTVPNYKWDAEAAPSLFDANIVVHLVHKTQDVTNTDPGAQETRTVTADFVKINENGTPEETPFDSATLDVYYIRQATKDLATGKVTYGDWKLNTSKGTNGLQVANGSWNLPTNSSADVTVNAPEAPDGYVKVDSQVNGQSTTNFGTAANISSKLTTYYVPKSLTEKTVNRVINVTPPNDPGQPSVTHTTTQSATLTRPVRVNADDSGVVFDGFTGSGWTTGQWVRFRDIWSPNNYTRIIKQIVTNPDGTTTETTLNLPFPRPIPDQTVNGDTPDTVINITYTAVATATLSGTNESTYTGSPITVDDLNNGFGDDSIYATVTGPTGNLYSLQAGDVEFSSDNGQTWSIALPTNAGTYELRWTAQGKQNIIKAYGNNSIKWEEDGQSTITGTATYIINPAPATSTLSNQTSGNYTKVYDAQPTTSIDASKLTITTNFNNTEVTLDMAGLNNDSYEWVDANGNPITNPENVGTYYIKLKDSALATLQKDNPNFILTNTGLAIYTITAAENTVSVDGTQTETYTGQPISVDYNANGTNSVQVSISAKDGATASLSNVQLDSDDFQIVDVSGNPITAENAGGVYHIILTNDGTAKIQKAVGDNYKISQGTSFGTLVINKAQASAEFSGNPSSTYTGTPNSNYLNGFSIKLNEPNNPTYNLVAGDIEFNVDGTWTTTVPVNVGKHEVRLSQAGWDHIKAINSDNVTWPASASAGTGTYTITAASANTQLSGHNSMVYNGNSVTTADLYTDGSTIKVAISGNNIVNLPSSFILEDGDYTWNTQDGKAPVNAGNYSLTLSSAGLDKIQAAIDEAVGKGNVILSKDNTGSATFQIAQAISPDVQLDGNEKSEYNGHAVSFDPTNEETKKNFGFNNVQGLTIPNLTADDFEWVDQDGNQISAPTNAGYYYLQLNEKGNSAFAAANPNYTFVKDGNSTISGHITYQIYPASLVIGVTGTASEVYNGQNAAITQTQLDNGDIKLVWGNSTDEPIGLGGFTLTPEDLEVVDSAGNPVSHANAQENDKTGDPAYYVRLTNAALNKIKALTGASNYDISLGGTTGNFLIYARKAQVTLSGNQTTTYGTDLALDPSAYHIELTNWNSSVPVPTDAEIIQVIGGLKSGDVYINGFTNGQMPVNVGTYQVKIADQLLQRLQAAFPDYDWDAVSGTNSPARSGSSDATTVDGKHEPATYVITPADTTVTINGAEHIKYGENSTIQYGDDNGYTITITAPVKNATTDNEHEPIYTDLKLETGDLEFVTTPGNVGTYQVKLSAQGLKKLQDLTGSTNYNWTQASEARANFFVDQMPVTIAVGGNEQNVTYGSNDWLSAIKKNPQGYTITVKTENGTLNYQAKDGDLIFSQTPGNVGSYQVVLSSQGLDNIKTALGTNYAYPQAAGDVTTYGTFNVSQGEVTISLDGSDSKTYDGKTTTPSDLNTGKYNLTYSATVYAPDGTAQTIQLTAEDLQFVNGDPINAGSYTVELSPAGQAKLKSLTGNNGDNYKWTFNTNATYTINAATDASASLSGSNQMIFNGSVVTTAEINNGGDIIVNLTFPGSTENSIYHLQDGDYIWTNGEAPTNVGTYTIELTADGLAHLQAAIDQYAGSGNVKISADSLTGSATFEIVPKSITDVTISGKDQAKTYDGQPASLDVKDLTINANDLVTDNQLSMKGITASDFDWYDAQGNKLDVVPTNAGTYEARLKSTALQTLQADNPNYSFNTANGTIKYTINQKAATDTLGGNGNKVYNGQRTSVSDVLDSITWTSRDLVDGQSLDLSNLTADDYAWYTKNADGTYTEMTGLPTNAGTYYLKLKDSSIAKIQAANPNYSFATGAISGEYTYVINKANADVSISGSQTTKDLAIDSNNYQDSVKTNNDQDLTIPKLTADDFVVATKDGQKVKASQLTEAGTYNVELSEDAINKIRQANPNYDIAFSSTAIFTLENSSQTINYVDADNKVISSTNISGHIKGTKLPFIPQFPAGWIASDPSSVPSEITLENGITTIKIKHGITNVDHTNPVPDGEKTVTGEVIDGAHENDLNQTITRTIVVTNPDGTKQTITQEGKIYRDATYDNVTGEVTYGEWSIAKWDAYTPENIPGYTVSESVVPAVEVKNGQQDETVNITYTANEQTGKISYQDTDGNAIGATSISGKTGETITVTPEIPAGWQLVPGQEIPKTVTATAEGIPTVVIKIKHGIINVDHTNPVPDGEKTPTGKVIEGAHASDLNQTITRTIIVTNPDGTKSTEVQTAKLYRDATYDDVTGEVTYGEWSTAKWDAYTPENIPGYTVSESVVPAVEVKNGQQDETVNITYTANEQSGKISYQDADGKEIRTTPLSGKTGETVAITPDIPAGWQLVPGQDIPKTVTATAEGIPTVIVKVEHKKIIVTPDTPTEDIPNGKVPGDPNKTYEKMDDLVKTPTRTIVVTKPDGSKQTITQSVEFIRTATFDEVTGEITYSDWTLNSKSSKWDAYTPETIPGYTANPAQVAEEDVNQETDNTTVNITYTANEQSGIISYQDKAGNEIGTTPLSGKTGETITITPEVPAGWQLVPGQEIPKTVTATAEGIPTVIVKVEHKTVVVTPETPSTDIPTGKVPGDPSKNYPLMEQLTVTPTRTINVKYPSGKEDSIPQKVTFTRTAIFDEVTGEIKYTEWLSQGTAQWASYQPTTVTGYVPSQKIVPAMTVNPETSNETVDITYNKIPEPQEGQEIISYQDANGQVIHTQTVTGKENSDVSFKPEVPTNWQPTGELPQSVKITGGTTVIVIEPITAPVQEHKKVTRTIVEHLPSGDKQTVQTVVLTGTGTKNLVTGEVTDIKWDHGKLAAFTPTTVPGYTTNMSIVPKVNVTAASDDSIVEINYIPNEQTGFIIYRDENGSDISQTVLQGKTGEKIAVNLTVPAGWELVPGQSIPATVMATPAGIPNVVVLIKHQTIIVKPGEEAPTGKVPGNPSTTYEKMESLTKEVTRTITVKLPDGQRQIITQTVKFTRTATFDAVTGKVTYSGWQVDGNDEWPAYTAPEINGYTASQVSIPAEMVIPSDENQSIEIEYTKNNQPVEPDKPVTPITPDQPTTPTNPDQPAQPTEPSVPAKPIAPTNNGNKVMSGNQLPTEPVEQEKQQVPNQHFISHQLTQTSSKEKSKANILPQTGNDQNSSSILGFAFAALASILGLTGLKKKREK